MLTPTDPNPVELISSSEQNRLVLVCDHAGREIPSVRRHQPLSTEDMKRHIAWDVNARNVAVIVAKKLRAPLVAQRYSRLVIDMNRPVQSPDSIPVVSDGTLIPFNQNISDEERKSRIDSIYRPYHAKIAEHLNDISSSMKFIVAIHSFTPKLRNGPFRNWHVDLISRTRLEFVTSFRRQLRSKVPNLNIGLGDVFPMDAKRDFTLPFHAESRDIYNMSIEIRNDLLQNQDGIDCWGDLVATCLQSTVEKLTNRSDS